MPVSLLVSQIRDQVLQAAGGPVKSIGGASNRVAGSLFHSVAADLFGNQPALQAEAAFVNIEPDLAKWRAVLRDHIYRVLLGPRLQANHAVLQQASTEVTVLWSALEAFADWSAELLYSAWRGRSTAADAAAADLGTLLAVEQTLTWTLKEPGWTDSVIVTGITDMICRIPETDSWCVAEFRTGDMAPEADIAQACLYHQMLTASEAVPGSLVQVYFTPAIHQHAFSPEDLRAMEGRLGTRLKTAIGRMAGVLPDQKRGDAQSGTDKFPASTPLRTPEASHIEFGRKLRDVFRQFNAPVEFLGDPVVAPQFLRFPMRPARGIRPEAIRKLSTALQVRLGLKTLPFIHNPGGRMVVDVERSDREIVPFSAVRDQLPAPDSVAGSSKLPVGVDLERKLTFVDLADFANSHLLLAGTAGSGKTEWLRMAIAGLLMTNTPRTLRLILIDPKRTAFSDLNGSPYVWGDGKILYPDQVSLVTTLNDIVDEMDRRYRLFQQNGFESIRQYHQSGKQLPRIVFVCEEYSELLSLGRKEIEIRIQRLGQKARGAGLHMILTAQQPSRDIVKGTLQANIPARIGLRVNSPIESRMLLDRDGAEELLGEGDLLLKDIGEPVRLQAPLLSADDRRRIFGGAAR
ncbi:MAG TPA: FtsK/SpoIIIE domain-containing protein [Bryobacteraceae bacterium]